MGRRLPIARRLRRRWPRTLAARPAAPTWTHASSTPALRARSTSTRACETPGGAARPMLARKLGPVVRETPACGRHRTAACASKHQAEEDHGTALLGRLCHSTVALIDSQCCRDLPKAQVLAAQRR